MKKLDPAFKASAVKGIHEPKMQQSERNAAKKTMTYSTSRRTGRKVKS